MSCASTRRRDVTLAMVSAGVLLFTVPAAFAQSVAPVPESERSWLAGPVRLFPSITFRDVGFDSNIRNQSENPTSDFTFTTQPKLIAAVRLGPTQLVGTVTLGFVYYATAKEEQSVNRLYEMRLQSTTSRVRPFLTAALNHTRDRAGYEIDARVLRREANVTVGAEMKLTPVTSITGSYRHAVQDYGDDEQILGTLLAQQLDYRSDIVTAGAKLALTPLTTVSVDFDFQQDRFDRSALRDANSLRVLPAAEFSPDAAITGRVALGFRQFRPLYSLLPPFQGLVGSAHLTGTVLSSTRISFDGARDVTYSYDPLTPYYILGTALVTVTQPIGGPLDLIGILGADRLDYVALETLSSPGRVDRTRTVGGGLGFRASPSLRIAIVYDFTERRSTEIDRRAYNRQRLFGSVTYTL
jgi:hypothetical protein